MQSPLRSVLVAVGAATVLAVGTVQAFAGWSTTAPPKAVIGSTASMPRTDAPTAVARKGAAVVTWETQTISNRPMTQYIVTGYSVAKPAGKTIRRTLNATPGVAQSEAFAAKDVRGGTWQWTITPKFRSWTGSESGRSNTCVFPSATPADDVTAATDPPSPSPTAAGTKKPAGVTAPTTPKPDAKPTEATTVSPPEQKPAEQKPADPTTPAAAPTADTTPAETPAQATEAKPVAAAQPGTDK